MDLTQRVWLVRHAESAANAGLVTTNPTDTPITELGREQARRFAHRTCILSPRPALIVTSPYLRTKQTAEPFQAAFPDVPREEWPVQEFTYLNIEKNANKTFAQREPDKGAYWDRNDPEYVDGEGAESFIGCFERVFDMFCRLPKAPSPVVIFTHGHFMRFVLWTFLSPEVTRWRESMSHVHALEQAVPIDNMAVLPLLYEDGNWFAGGLYRL